MIGGMRRVVAMWALSFQSMARLLRLDSSLSMKDGAQMSRAFEPGAAVAEL